MVSPGLIRTLQVVNYQVFLKAEVRKVYPTQIDLQFNYHELQKIETNWLNGFNREGSQAYKMSFVAYLLVEFLKKARMEVLKETYQFSENCS